MNVRLISSPLARKIRPLSSPSTFQPSFPTPRIATLNQFSKRYYADSSQFQFRTIPHFKATRMGMRSIPASKYLPYLTENTQPWNYHNLAIAVLPVQRNYCDCVLPREDPMSLLESKSRLTSQPTSTLYVCQRKACRRQIRLIPPAGSSGTPKPLCTCGSEMKKPYSTPRLSRLTKAEALRQIGQSATAQHA
jgi:hypothetical protein